MADEKKQDQFATETPAGKPAYPQVVYGETGEKYPDNSPVTKVLGTAKTPEEHKELLKNNTNTAKEQPKPAAAPAANPVPAWDKDKK